MEQIKKALGFYKSISKSPKSSESQKKQKSSLSGLKCELTLETQCSSTNEQASINSAEELCAEKCFQRV